MTLRIPADQINASLQKEFPISRHTPYGEITLTDPQASIRAGSDRVTAGATLLFHNALIPRQRGLLYLSGIPYFDAKEGAIYLRRPRLEKVEFNGYTVNGMLKKSIQTQLQPIIDQFFAQIPIYRIDRNSLAGSFVKDISVGDGALLVHFGL